MGYPSGGSLATSIRAIEVSTDGASGLRGKTYTVVMALTAHTPAAVTVPTFPTEVPSGTSPAETTSTAQASRVVFGSSGGDFWANYDIALAVVPAANITDGTAPEVNPTTRIIQDVTTINLISAYNVLVSMLFFQG